ncbi:MAG TPA: class I SAM-dependent methyltransferase [Acidobacteriaceae bacterium]|nr:class I SAM-dependent methyltransferase [Acidobacteriaceae bacterium]
MNLKTHSETGAPQQNVNYGLDAPIFQRNALFGGLSAAILGTVVARWAHQHGSQVAFSFATSVAWTGLWFFLTGCVMFWGSKVGKLHLRDKIIASIPWRGDEQVLDVGCGHGMMLLAAAKQLKSGHAIGIDIWSQADQADNNPESTMANAHLENVADRVEILNADARSLPFPDNSFDVVVSSFVIHNLNQPADREQVIREIARVLKPGGQLAIADIRHTRQYERTLRTLGWTSLQRWFPNFLFVTPTRVLRGARP